MDLDQERSDVRARSYGAVVEPQTDLEIPTHMQLWTNKNTYEFKTNGKYTVILSAMLLFSLEIPNHVRPTSVVVLS